MTTIGYLTERICFSKTDKEQLYADIYLPAKSPESTPLLLMIHGGAWKAGSKEMNREWGALLAQEGYCVMSIDYRLATEEEPTWPGVLDDVKASLSYMLNQAAKYKIDTQRIGLIGDSCGAQLSILLSLEDKFSESIQAIVGIYGVYDVKQWWEYTQERRDDDPVARFMGASPNKIPDAYLEASPLHRIERVLRKGKNLNTKFFVVWGDEDQIVPCQQSKDFVQLLDHYGVYTKTLEFSGFGHFWFSILPGVEGGGIKDQPNKHLLPPLLNFLDEQLFKA